MSYYDELSTDPNWARRVGWKRRIGQAFRFELVGQLLEPGDVLLDVGCGAAALARWVSARDVVYVGVDALRHELEYEADVRQLDALVDPLPSADLVAAIGTLVDGNPRTEEEQRHRATEFVTRLKRAAGRGILVAVDLGSLDARPWRRDEALAGVRREWFEDELVQVSEDEVALVWGGAIDARRALVSLESSPFGPWPPSELAWISARCGAVGLAERWLAQAEAADSLAQVVRERLESF